MKESYNQLLGLALFVLLVSTSLALCQGAESIYERLHNKSDLPTGGEFVQHLHKESVVFYYTNHNLMWPDKTDAQKHPGLYRSTDGGETWKLLCYYFDFKQLFIHPDTGKLYAIIQAQWLAADDNGFLVPHIADKAIMSDDGKKWVDIMGKQKYVATLFGIFADPDNPGRVCLKGNTIRSYVLQATDDSYTEWKWHRQWDWPTRQENYNEKK